jgi:hypothetical protein
VGDAVVSGALVAVAQSEEGVHRAGVGVGDPEVDLGRIAPQLAGGAYRFSSARTSSSDVAMVWAA